MPRATSALCSSARHDQVNAQHCLLLLPARLTDCNADCFCWCRTEVKSWTHKHTDLGCEVYPLRRTSQVTGVRGTTSDKSNWKKTFEAVCGASASLLCFAKGCPLFSRVGGHLWLYDAAEQRYDFEHCYIAPLCKRHNAREFDYPHPFLLKRDVTVMRIVPHTCYLDYGPLPSRRAAA